MPRAILLATLITISLMLGASAQERAPTTARANATPTRVSFARDVAPLFRSRCVMCHMPGDAAQATLALHPNGGYANLVGVRSTQSPMLRVAPGNPQGSYLYRKLAGTHVAAGGSGERMPFGSAALTPAQLDTIRLWIEGGATNN